MATKTTGWYCACSASVTASTATTATITVYCYWQNNGWRYGINNVSAWVYCNGKPYQVKDAGSIDADSSNTQKVSCGSHSFTVSKTTSKQSISCYAKITSASSYVSGTKTSSTVSVSVAAKTSYTVKYNANGGSGAPSNQTKWYGTTLTLSSTKPTRTGYTFKGWGTSASATTVSYAAGASYTANAAVTLYAIWTANTYTVKYNANGGSGAPSNQTKTYGVSLKLSSTKPTRTNYTFKGWGTSASATTVVYAAGASYTTNASVTLYAIWELAYTKPRITGFTIARCNSSGTESDEGTYCLVKFSWATDKTVSSITAKYKLSSAADSAYTSTTISASGTSGSVSKVIGGGALSTENTYTIYVSVTDSGGTSYKTKTLSAMEFSIDCLDGGSGVAIGKPAELEGYFDVKYLMKLRDSIEFAVANKRIYGVDTDGTLKEGFNPVNNSGNTVLGYGNYTKKFGNTNVYGYDVTIGVSNLATAYSYRPYIRQGDSFNVDLYISGWTSNGGADIYFTIFLSRPIIGSPTVTCTSIDGFRLRQNNAYTHGCTYNKFVTPSSMTATTRYTYGVTVKATFSTTTNVVNNAPIGIDFYGTLTFS